MKSKLCISPIISVILILVVTTISVTSFLSWYSSYESNLNTKIESTVIDSNSLSIETIAGSVLYVKSNENTTIKSIKLDNNICSLDLNLTAGINEIDISTCLNNLTRSNPSVSLVSDNQVLSKNIYIKTAIINSTSSLVSYNNCSIGNHTIQHGESEIFYLSSSSIVCINQTRTCNNGVLNGSYEYLQCDIQIALGGDEIYDIEINNINYRIHIFRTLGLHNFEIITDKNIEYLVVGGGGAGARGSGGGGGGFVEGNVSISAGNITIKVGSGANSSYERSSGEDSYLGSIVARGGGSAGTWNEYGPGQNGGSGGATSAPWWSAGSSLQFSGLGYGFGNSGGVGYATGNVGNSWGNTAGGGGGGAGGSGENALSSPLTAGRGGLGKQSSITGELVWYSGGGSGASFYNPGGGNYPQNINYVSAVLGGGGGGSFESRDAQPNTGGGGGAGMIDSSWDWSLGGYGGSGVVIIRYAIN